ncbi:MAG TPA: SDR family oxidoreductase [Burkholderiaceae bacterium]|nr:SDR family oxidoreductase [Burkholderiaceae bacterium]
MQIFKDKVAIVTGGASGIGRMLCEELASHGATVIVADRNQAGAGHVANVIRERGGHAAARHVDVTNEADVRRLIDDTVREHRHLDYMFNNAGTAAAGDFRDIRTEHWRSVIDVNLWGVIYGTTYAYAVMVRQGAGHIVNIASVGGLLPFPSSIPYATTKHGVVGLSSSLRLEAADLGVKVSVVCPGFVETNLKHTAAMVNLPRDQTNALVPSYMDSREAARAALRGVARNRGVIVFPTIGRVLWALYRINMALVLPGMRKTVRNFRALRMQARTQSVAVKP